ncbi:MAG: maltose alpha-D-glucosyltransferase [Actinomycetota bacterium]
MADDRLLWYRDAIIYELHLRAYSDSNADGIGDVRGLTQKLDYLQDLGVTAIWLLPFYPSPLRDDGYDIAEYTKIHPSYGTVREFRHLLSEAHERGIRVITELVLNHTSDQHPWFQRARGSPEGSPERDFYVWSDTSDRYRGTRIIFKDFESSNWAWDPVAKAYYWHRFYSHQPDLNFDNPLVQEAMLRVVDFWLEMGVDGMRLDAIPYLFQREGTTGENLPETHEFLKKLRAHVDARFDDRLLLAEANQWPEDAVTYMGAGDECQMAFHFPLMPRMFMSIQMEDRFPLIDIMAQTPAIPDNCQWALFLRNHDELTLEMVTDEERDYMYRSYATDPQARINLGIRRRLAPLLGSDRRRIELMNGLLFSLPGAPVLYYGDEIGMGDTIYLGDRNGVRTPMQWSPDRNAGFSRANPQSLYLPTIIDPEYHYEAVNVEAQQNNPNSLLWWTKRIIAQRKRWKAFGSGTLEFLYPENRKVLAFLRVLDDERILVVANLSRHSQYVELDLSSLKDLVPLELFGGNEFPRIGELPYLMTLSPYGFYWFVLSPQEGIHVRSPEARVLNLQVSGDWQQVFQRETLPALEEAISQFLPAQRWFGSKSRRIRWVSVLDAIPVPAESRSQPLHSPIAGYLVLARIDYVEGDPETYLIPMAWLEGQRALEFEKYNPGGLVARLATRDGDGVLIDALLDPGFCRSLLKAIARRRTLKGFAGKATGRTTSYLRSVADIDSLEPAMLQVEQSNTSLLYGDQLFLKLVRKIDYGINPDLEVGSFLTQRTEFSHIAAVAGSIEYVRKRPESMTFAILQQFVPNEGDAWNYTLDALGRYYEQALVERRKPPDTEGHLLDLAGQEPSEMVRELIGPYFESALLIGTRTGELHLALASDETDPSFSPEWFTEHHTRGLYQSMRSLTRRVFISLRTLAEVNPEIKKVLDLEEDVLKRFSRILEIRPSALRTRCHGDYHLGQVLYTGKDFVIVDFEGEPARPLSERGFKRSPLTDVAGMVRSFSYAAHAPIIGGTSSTGPEPREEDALQPWARVWYRWAAASFLRGYLEAVEGSPLLPAGREELQRMLDFYLLEKAIYELGYESNHRPDWVRIPVSGLLELVEGES